MVMTSAAINMLGGGKGWECPKCKTILNPNLKECPNCKPVDENKNNMNSQTQLLTE